MVKWWDFSGVCEKNFGNFRMCFIWIERCFKRSKRLQEFEEIHHWQQHPTFDFRKTQMRQPGICLNIGNLSTNRQKYSTWFCFFRTEHKQKQKQQQTNKPDFWLFEWKWTTTEATEIATLCTISSFWCKITCNILKTNKWINKEMNKQSINWNEMVASFENVENNWEF